MAEHRPFPPSARRLGLARAAGLHAASPILVGAIACGAAVIAFVALGRVTSARLGASIVAACEGTASLPAPEALATTVLDLTVPALLAAALAAVFAHLAQTRAVWLPRRTIHGAPRPPSDHAARASLDLTAGLVIAAVTIGWLWVMAPRLAALTLSPLAGGLVIASFGAAIAIAWVALGIVDALARQAQLTGALRMTPADKREDERLAGADPRWKQQRARAARSGSNLRAGRARGVAHDPSDAIAGSSVLILGDDVAVAIAWDPLHRPVPVRTAVGRAAQATQLLGLARRHGLAVHHEPALASQLADRDGAVVQEHWPRLAEVIAATRSR